MKNKKILTLLLVSVILSTPSVTFASWWNPFTWGKKQNNTSKSLIIVDTATTTVKAVSKNTTATTTQLMKKITEPVSKDKTTKISTKSSCNEDCQNALLTKKLEGLRLQDEIDLLKKQLEGSNKYQASATADRVQSVVFDACKNIEGVQSLVPGGMYGDNGNCLQIPINNQRPQVLLTPLINAKLDFVKGRVTNLGNLNALYHIKNDTKDLISIAGIKLRFLITKPMTAIPQTYVNVGMGESASPNTPILENGTIDLTFNNPFTLLPYSTGKLSLEVNNMGGNIGYDASVSIEILSVSTLTANVNVAGLPTQNTIVRNSETWFTE